MRGNETGFAQGRQNSGSRKLKRCAFLKHFLHWDSRNSSCPRRSPAEINVSIDPGGCAIPGMDPLAKLIRPAFLYQVHGAATESPARHAGSITTGKFGGNFDQGIQLAATGFEVVAEAAVCFCHQNSESREVSALESRGGSFDSLVLGDDVAAATKDVRRHL